MSSRISQLESATTIAPDDIIVLTQDAISAPISRKTTVEQLLNEVVIPDIPEVLGDLTDTDLSDAREYNVLVKVGDTWTAYTPYETISSPNVASYELTVGDDGTFLVFDDSNPVSVEVQDDADWNDAPNAPELSIANLGTGTVTIAGAVGVTVDRKASVTNVINGRYAVCRLKRIGANRWLLYGDLTPV